MATAPYIKAYELFKDQPSKEVGTILSPDQLYAIATAMSYVESDFMVRRKTPNEVRSALYYHKWTRKAPAETLALFAWYCQTCNEIAILFDGSGLEDKSSWKANPADFARSVRKFLSLILFTGMPLNKELGFACSNILGGFNEMIEREVEKRDAKQKSSEKKNSMVRRILLYPLWKILQSLVPVYLNKFDRKTALLAHESLERIINLCRQAMEEGRVFTFSVPEDQCEGGVSIGGMKMQNMKGGGMVSTQFLS